LVLVGEEDQATPPSLAEQVHSLIPGSRLETLPGIAHAPHLQDPEGLSAAIERFQKMR
jgi:3-oxoadipate enol-lactonase